MILAGIVAEYNPFHTGHAYQVAQTRQILGEQTCVAAVMSGNWVQQADCAVADKWLRTRLALMGGIDLVLELPTVWAMSSAEGFARGAVSLLHATGVAQALCFGSECGQLAPLDQLARCLNRPEYEQALSGLLGEGTSFPNARQAAAEQLLGQTAQLLSKPNNNLGVEYMRALYSLGSSIAPMTVLRQGAAHNSLSTGTNQPSPFLSATQIRLHLTQGEWDLAQPYLVQGGRELLQGHTIGLPALARVERGVLARLRLMSAQDWAALPDSGVGEGLPKRLERAGRQCSSMDEFFALAKTKRYTHARLRRLVLWAWLGLTAADIPESPPYLRVLGFNEMGRQALRQIKEHASVPILTKPAHARQLDTEGRRLFELEARCTDLYDLCFDAVPTPGREWVTGPVIL